MISSNISKLDSQRIRSAPFESVYQGLSEKSKLGGRGSLYMDADSPILGWCPVSIWFSVPYTSGEHTLIFLRTRSQAKCGGNERYIFEVGKKND